MTAGGHPDLLDDRWRQVPLHLRTDPALGGRWTSLLTADREWLWRHPDPAVHAARAGAGPADDFVDAGGVEECFPTVRGGPDHGAAWSVGWHKDGASAAGTTAFGRLTRTVSESESVQLDYRIDGAAGQPFLHAVHALVEVSPTARLIVPGASATKVLDVPTPGDVSTIEWPLLDGADLSTLGPDDGSATCALLLECSSAVLVDGSAALAFGWSTADPEQQRLCSLLFWRNLRGWPEAGPYRSIGIEPMIGRVADLERAGPGEAGSLDADGSFSWTLQISAWVL